jgi:hypothetical protein
VARFVRLFHILVVSLVLLGLLAGSTGALALAPEAAPVWLPEPERAQAAWQAVQEIPEAFELVGENTLFQLYANQETLAFKVVDKRSGYVWHSNLDERAEGDRLNRTWTAFAASGVTVEYLDDKGVSKRVSISNTEHTTHFTHIDQGFEALVEFTEFAITVGITVRLDDAGVRVEVPFDTIQEAGEFKLGMLHLYPFMGATRADSIPGYMFIPDGSGSLIRFSAATKARNMMYERYYGSDLGMLAILPYNPTVVRPYKASIPVTGMSHGFGDHAYIAIVEKGASYGEIQAHPSGIITNFNFLYNAFLYNQSYFQATNRSGAGVTVMQPQTNRFDIAILYRFLTTGESDYVGMALSYQQYLVEKGALKQVVDPSPEIGLRLEFLGAEKEKILFWNRSIPMTTVQQMGEILDDLQIANVDVVYYGWQAHGASSMPPKTVKLDSTLGSARSLGALVEDIQSRGGNFYLYYDPQAALMYESGYSPRNDLAIAITNVNLVGYNRHKVNYFFNFPTLSERYASLRQNAASDLNAGLALDMIGSTLYSDHKKGSAISREDAIALYQQMLAEQGGLTAFYLPNDYMFGFMDAYYDMPLASSGYIYTSEAVPFLQIVLAGYVPFYGPATNFSSDARADLLRHIETGAYPSYFLSSEPTSKILNTASNWIYSSSYEQWGERVKATYQWMNSLLSPVKGERITAREVLRRGVVATTYSNGYQLVVNYNDAPYAVGEYEVGPLDALLRKVEP